jgi:hypothetical protein
MMEQSLTLNHLSWGCTFTISRKVSIERNKIKGEQERIKNAMVIEAVVEIK